MSPSPSARIARGFTFPGGQARRALRCGALRPLPQHARPPARPAPHAGAGQPHADRFQRTERGRLRGAPRARHREFLGLQTLRRRRQGGGSAGVDFADDARLYVPLEQSFLVSRYVGVGQARTRRFPRSATRAGPRPRNPRSRRSSIRRAAAGRPRRARDQPGLRLSAGQQMAARIRALLSLQGNAGPAHRHRRDQGGHGIRAAHGPAHLRRCRLRQDGGGHPRRVQGGDGRQAGRLPRADHGARAAALPEFPRAHVRLPGPVEMLSRFRSQAEQTQDGAGSARRAASISSSARTGSSRRTWRSRISGWW